MARLALACFASVATFVLSFAVMFGLDLWLSPREPTPDPEAFQGVDFTFLFFIPIAVMLAIAAGAWTLSATRRLTRTGRLVGATLTAIWLALAAASYFAFESARTAPPESFSMPGAFLPALALVLYSLGLVLVFVCYGIVRMVERVRLRQHGPNSN
jgi:hypothetical protein